jgi:ABC-type sugar transport system permease subunit
MQADGAGTSGYIGFANFQRALSDPIFRIAVRNTIRYTLIFLFVQLPLALLIAVGINSLKRQFFRQTALTLYFLPLVTSMVASAVVFVYMYHPVFGLINHGLASLGLPTFRYLTDMNQALPSVTAMAIWKSLGFPVIIFLTGLLTIPRELYDAATVDGANSWMQFRRITLPLLRPTITLLILIQGIESLRSFTPVYTMTGRSAERPGGPANSTMVLSLHIFQQAFLFNRFGYASALAIFMFVAIVFFMFVLLRVTKVKWEY